MNSDSASEDTQTPNSPTPKEYRCPACGREVYSRRRRTCDFCDQPLPPEFMLTEEEREAIDKELLEIRQRRERDKERDEEERKKAQARSSESGPLFF